MASNLYTPFLAGIQKAQIADLSSAGTTLKCALMTSSYTPNYTTDTFWSDISANETSGTNYTAGGTTVGSKTVSVADPSVFDAADTVFTNVTLTCRYAVLYIDTGNPATSRLIECHDFGADKSPSAGNLTITWNASGIHSIGT